MTEPIDRTRATTLASELRHRVRDRVESTTVGLEQIAGRTLAEDVVATGALPKRSHATMDGYAYAAGGESPLEVLPGEVYAETEPPSLEEGQAIRIATGAPLPDAADTVVTVEEATVQNGMLDRPDLEPGTYVYERGSNVAAGDELYAAGDRLRSADAILLRDSGLDRVAVDRRFDVHLLATGTELHEGRQPDLDSAMLANLIRSWGHQVSIDGTVPDVNDRVRERIAALAATADCVVTTGGTSVGETDHTIAALQRLGSVRFHRVAIRPGKPIAMADLPDHECVAVAIPGKPIGAYVSAVFVARTLFTGESKHPSVPARVAVDVDLGPEGFEYVIPVDIDGGVATPLGHPTSPVEVYRDRFDPSVASATTRVAAADGFVVTTTPLAAGDSVDVVRSQDLE